MFKKISYLICLVFFLILPFFVFAGDTEALKNLKGLGGESGYEVGSVDEYTFSNILGVIVNVFLGFLGIIFVGLIIYAGYLWMNARGNEEDVKKAKDTMRMAIIGLIIVVSAWAIWSVVWSALFSATAF